MSSTIQTTSQLQATLQRVTKIPAYQELLAELRRGAQIISISGLITGSARALALAALQKETGKRFAVVAPATRDLEAYKPEVNKCFRSAESSPRRLRIDIPLT